MMAARLLTDLLAGLDYTTDCDLSGVMIRSLAVDSRKAEEGSLFVCVRGLAVDGHGFANAAIAKGAVAIIADRDRQGSLCLDRDIAVVWVADTRQVIGEIAAAWYQHPAAGLTLIGLTGTNGKTTTTFILEAMVRAAGGNPGVIGTINYRYGGREVPASFTTPEPLELQRLLREMADHRVSHVIMEVSSHALALHRIGGLRFDAALFTNLTRDHLDFHREMEAYYQAKKRLFTDFLRPGGTAVVILDPSRDGEPDWGARLSRELDGLRQTGALRLITCGLDAADAEVAVVSAHFGRGETTAELTVMGRPLAVRTNLVGLFNLKNVLGAIGVAIGLGLDHEAIARGLALPIRVPGRLEAVTVAGAKGLPVVFVDYAHTPDALENVLATLRQLQPRRLVVVFGCGGDRDPGKRRIMGEIAGRLADVAIITADNSRSESPAAIMAAIEEGVIATGKSPWAGKEADGYLALEARAEAIEQAIALAGEEDIVLISGKGHETYQITATGTAFFDDRLEAARSLTDKQKRRDAAPNAD